MINFFQLTEDTIRSPKWADPRIWLATAAILVILTLIMIYKAFTSEKRP